MNSSIDLNIDLNIFNLAEVTVKAYMRIQSFLIVTVATLVCWWMLLPWVNKLKLPLDETYGIISSAVVLGRNPSTNVAIYLLLLLIPSLIIMGFITLQDRLKSILHSSYAVKIAEFSTDDRIIRFIVFFLSIVWIFNVSVPDPGFISKFPKDGFHFGEKIGLAAAYLQKPGEFFEQSYMLIHGFGLNVLPGVMGRILGGQDLNVAFTLYVVYLQNFLAIAFSFLILYEVATFLSPRHRWNALLPLCLIYFALHGTIFALFDRDTIFVLQAYLILRWLRSENATNLETDAAKTVFQHRFYPLIYPFLVAFSIPFSIIYVYDRASYFIALFICVLVYFLITTSKSHLAKILAASLVGFLTASLLLSLSLGFNVLPSAIHQILYWSKVSGLFTGLPYPSITLSVSSLINWVSILLQSITLTLLCLQFREECLISGKKARVFLTENYLPIFLFLCAVLYMRVALGRSDGGHLISPGFFAVFAFIALISRIISQRQLIRVSWQNLTLIAFIAASLFNMNSVFAAVNLGSLASYPATMQSFLTQTNSTLLDPEQQIVARQIRKYVNSQSCFYTLASEGIWYELLDKPPCSRYWYLIYATSPDTQQQVVQDLEKTKPRIILYSGGFGDVLDGVPKESSHLLVHQYIWQHYRPYRLIKGRWLWIRRNSIPSLNQLLVPQPNDVSGSFDGIIKPVDQPNLFSAVGWAIAPDIRSQENKKEPQEKSAILLTVNPVAHPDKIILMNVGRVFQQRPDVAAVLGKPEALAGWSVSINQLNLPSGNFEMKAWVYNSTDRKFYQISQSHSFEVKPSGLPVFS